MSLSFRTSDGLALSYSVVDETPPWRPADTLVLLHAAMGSSQRYFSWAPGLCGHYRVVRMDMRGHGASASPPPDEPFTMERLVQDVSELLDHIGCPAAHVAGNSAGGFIAMRS